MLTPEDTDACESNLRVENSTLVDQHGVSIGKGLFTSKAVSAGSIITSVSGSADHPLKVCLLTGCGLTGMRAHWMLDTGYCMLHADNAGSLDAEC